MSISIKAPTGDVTPSGTSGRGKRGRCPVQKIEPTRKQPEREISLWSLKTDSFEVYHDCPENLKETLRKIQFCGPDDPAFFVVYASDAQIHSALGLAGAPVGIRDADGNAAISAAKFKTWVAANIHGGNIERIGVSDVDGGGPPYSEEAFQRLSNNEAGSVVGHSVVNYAAWHVAVLAAGF